MLGSFADTHGSFADTHGCFVDTRGSFCGNTHISFANAQFFLRGKTESRSNVVLIAAEFVSAVGDSARKREARHAFVRPNELVKPF